MQELGADVLQNAKARLGLVLCGKFQLESLVDIGGMAAVYAARHRNGKRVAVKMLHAHFAQNQEVTRRFLREGYVANQIEHRGAMQILDDDTAEDGSPFLVMELLLGESMDKWMRRPEGYPAITDVLAIADQVLDVLGAFHARGIIHRDIKPGNLFVTTTGVIKVLDFGLARVRDLQMQGVPTASGTVLGTASYMSPEQAQGKVDSMDARTDLFSMGAVMFLALSGRVVHKGRTPMDRLMSAMQTPVEPLRTVAPDVPVPVCAVVDRALEFDKNHRYADAAEMRAAVRHAVVAMRDQPPPTLRRPEPPPPPVPAFQGPADEVSFDPSLVVEISFADLK